MPTHVESLIDGVLAATLGKQTFREAVGSAAAVGSAQAEDVLQILALDCGVLQRLLLLLLLFLLLVLLLVFVEVRLDPEFVLEQNELVDKFVLLLQKEVLNPRNLLHVSADPDRRELF